MTAGQLFQAGKLDETVRALGTELLTVRIDLDRPPQQ